jgi:preprotein translocase subunit SecB
MNDQTTDNPQQGKFNIHRVYIKDISFEAPNSPQVFNEKWQPKNGMDLNTTAQKLADNLYEVVLSITVTVKNGEQTAFLVEVHQAGIFQVEGFAEDQLQAVLGSFCPNIIFPYAREAVSDIVSRGGFPQLLLAPINFDALYQQHLQNQAKTEPEAAKH